MYPGLPHPIPVNFQLSGTLRVMKRKGGAGVNIPLAFEDVVDAGDGHEPLGDAFRLRGGLIVSEDDPRADRP